MILKIHKFLLLRAFFNRDKGKARRPFMGGHIFTSDERKGQRLLFKPTRKYGYFSMIFHAESESAALCAIRRDLLAFLKHFSLYLGHISLEKSRRQECLPDSYPLYQC